MSESKRVKTTEAKASRRALIRRVRRAHAADKAKREAEFARRAVQYAMKLALQLGDKMFPLPADFDVLEHPVDDDDLDAERQALRMAQASLCDDTPKCENCEDCARAGRLDEGLKADDGFMCDTCVCGKCAKPR